MLHVSRAHFYADAVRDEHVRLPDEDPLAKEPGVRGKQRKMMYGSLDAAQRWGEHYAQVLEAGAFIRGVLFVPLLPSRIANLRLGAR